MSKFYDKHVAKALMALADEPNIKRVTTYISPKLTVKVTHQRKPRANARQITFLVSVGAPNFLERRVIKADKIKYPTTKYESFTKS